MARAWQVTPGTSIKIAHWSKPARETVVRCAFRPSRTGQAGSVGSGWAGKFTRLMKAPGSKTTGSGSRGAT
eukprot:gene18801-biopygen16002